MYIDISPTVLYREYEARVAEALRKSDRARQAREEPVYRLTTWDRLRIRLVAWRDRLGRSLQPAEEGFVA